MESLVVAERQDAGGTAGGGVGLGSGVPGDRRFHRESRRGFAARTGIGREQSQLRPLRKPGVAAGFADGPAGAAAFAAQ